MIAATGAAITAQLDELEAIVAKRNGTATLVRKRFEKFRNMGVWQS